MGRHHPLVEHRALSEVETSAGRSYRGFRTGHAYARPVLPRVPDMSLVDSELLHGHHPLVEHQHRGPVIPPCHKVGNLRTAISGLSLERRPPVEEID